MEEKKKLYIFFPELSVLSQQDRVSQADMIETQLRSILLQLFSHQRDQTCLGLL